MTQLPIDYSSCDASRRRRKWPMRLALVVIMGLVILILPLSDVRQTSSRMDAVTGSMEWQDVWLFGMSAGPRVNASTLETRLRKMGLQWKRDWRGLHNIHQNILGHAIGYDCGTAPPIYQIQSVLPYFAAAATDEEIREFVRVMQTGTDIQQRVAVEAAGEKGLQALSAAPPDRAAPTPTPARF